MPKGKKTSKNKNIGAKGVVRPGAFHYSFYLSDRHPRHVESVKTSKKKLHDKKQSKEPKAAASAAKPSQAIFTMIIILLLGSVAYGIAQLTVPKIIASTRSHSETAHNYCASNSLTNYIKVSIGARKLWACSGPKQVYESAVVTGYEGDISDKTPVGTYHIFTKETNVTLKGSDDSGGWSDPVGYWMPFLFNQYGAYGFHDATWRSPSAFGNISPNSKDASHGCVELPLTTAKWLYGWAPVGTTVKIVS